MIQFPKIGLPNVNGLPKVGDMIQNLRNMLPGQQQPSPPSQPQHPMRQSSQDLKDKAKQLQDKIKNKGGMIPIVVHGAKLVCSETIPAKKINTLIVKDNRTKVEGKEMANIQDQKRDTNIKPWPCKCKKRPSGSDYKPCDYKPAGPWNKGTQTENSKNEKPKEMSDMEKKGRESGIARANEAMQHFKEQPQTLQALQDAAAQTGMNETALKTFATLESTGNGLVGDMDRYRGLMQMGERAANDVGMSLASMSGTSTAAIRNNALGGAKYLSKNLGQFGNQFAQNTLNGYLSHQQGFGGFKDLMKGLATNPGKAATPEMLRNLPENLRNGATYQDYYDYTKGKVEGIEDTLDGKTSPKGGKSELTLVKIATLKCTYGGTIEIIDPNQRSRLANPGGIKTLG